MTDDSARLIGVGCKNPWRSALAALCCVWPALVPAEIFRYQDDAGNWHFTDDPPDRYESSVVPGIRTSKASAPDSTPTRDFRLVRPQTRDPYWGATFGADRTRGIGPGQTGKLGPDQVGSVGADQVRTPGTGRDGTFGPEPVRLIIPGQDGGHRTNEPAEQPTARSLDFPPEGAGRAGLPRGISRPQE